MERNPERQNAQRQAVLKGAIIIAKRKRTTIKELNAMEELYGSRMTPSKVFRIIGSYEIVICGCAYFLYQSLPITFMYAFAGALFVYGAVVKKDIENRYRSRGLFERNKFINFITQSMTTKGAQILPVLTKSINKLNGEFKDDIQHLVAVLCTNSTDEEKRDAFAELNDKYEQDIYFCLFLDQVQTVYWESTYHVETFREFQNSHNLILMKQKEYKRTKNVYRHWTFMTVLGSMGLIVATAFMTGVLAGKGFGLTLFSTVYAHSLIGRICSTMYMFGLSFIMVRFFNCYYDDDIMEL